MAAPVLPGPLGALAPLLNQYGYLAVGALVLLEDFGVPAPGETVLVAAAVYAGTGRLNVVAVAVIGFVAAVVGDNIGFAIGHSGGRRLAVRFGRYVFLSPERLERAERFFTRHGGKVVTAARFITDSRGRHRGTQYPDVDDGDWTDMSTGDKVKGKLKETAGSLTGSDDLRKEGQAQQHKGHHKKQAEVASHERCK